MVTGQGLGKGGGYGAEVRPLSLGGTWCTLLYPERVGGLPAPGPPCCSQCRCLPTVQPMQQGCGLTAQGRC